MISRHLRKFANQAPKQCINNNKRSFFSFNREFDLLANSFMRDFDRSFSRRYDPWGSFGRSSSFFSEPVYYQPIRSTYEKKTITNGEDGRVIVKTMRKSPGRPWETYVEEYVDENTLQQNKKPEALEQSQKEQKVDQPATDQATTQQQTIEQPTAQAEKDAKPAEQKEVSKAQDEKAVTQSHVNDIFSEFDRDFRQLSESFTRDFDSFFAPRNTFSDLWNWNSRWFDSDPFFNPENTTYRLKTVVNNNGNVTVKTASKDPGSEWQTTVKQYSPDKGVEGAKKPEAIAEGNKTEQVIDQKVDAKEEVAAQQ